MSKAWTAHVPGVPKHTLTLAGETLSVRFLPAEARAGPLPDTGLVQFDELDARLSDPATLPAAVTPGTTTVATIDGTRYLLRLVGSIDTRIQAAINATGEAVRFTALEWLDWTVNRETRAGSNPDTGAPVTTRANLPQPAGGHFAWAGQRDRADYEAATEAVLVTLPGTLQAGDRITHATFGTFQVSEASPKAHGPFDLVELRRAA